MSSVLESIDIYRIKPNFFIKNGDSIPTKLGGALSILTILSSLALVIYTLIDVFSSKRYITSFTQESKKDYSLNMSKEKIFFKFFTGLEEMPNIDRIIEFRPYYYLLDVSDFQEKEKDIAYEKCRETGNSLEETERVSNFFSRDKFYCLSNLTDENTIFGDLSSHSIVASLQIDFKRCVNSTKNNNKCFSKVTIDSYLQNSTLVWGTEDYDIDHGLPGNPFKLKEFMESFQVIEDKYRIITVKKKEISYYSDKGLFTNNTETFFYPSYDFTSLQTNNIPKYDPNIFMTLSFQISGKREIYTRRYEKMQEALTIVSTMVNLMKVLGGLVVSLVGDKIYFEQLINSLLFGVGKEGNYASSAIEKDKEKHFSYMEIKRELFSSKSESRRCINGNNSDISRSIVNNNDNSGWNQLKSIISINNTHIQSQYHKKILASRLNDDSNNYHDANNIRKEDKESSCRNK